MKADKVVSLRQAIDDHVEDGMTVALEGFSHLIPFAAGHEIIRQGRRDLTLCRMTPDLIADQMIAAGCVTRLVASFFASASAGGLHEIRRRLEQHDPVALEVEDHYGMLCLPGAGGAARSCPTPGRSSSSCVATTSAPCRPSSTSAPQPVRCGPATTAAWALPPGFGVSTVVTPLGVLRRIDRFGELFLASVHPGVTPEQVQAATGWPLAVSDELEETPRPTEEDVRLLRDEIDTVRLYLR